PHEHDFSGEWKSDEKGHWHECPEDGERGDEAEHDFEWTTITAPTRKTSGEERGVCKVCGYQTIRELPYSADGKDIINRIPLIYPLVGIPALILLFVVLQEISVVRRRKGK
ncbi:MAG: hypothetical protein J5773_09005, partial [Verrucomicrobia bacterium]|nr:hypothetical protein [Verrucomicrobiota bacterium]